MATRSYVPGPSTTEQEMKQTFMNLMTSSTSNVETAAASVWDDLLDDVMLGLVHDIHQVCKMGGFQPKTTEEDMKSYAIVESSEADIFGQQYVKKSQECCCPTCHRPLSASRFAPHLEKCLGMGRNSSRIASRRIANNCKENAYGGVSDDDDDDWVAGQEKSRVSKKLDSKKKRDKNCVRRTKNQKTLHKEEKDEGHSSKTGDDFNQSSKYDSSDVKQ